MNLLKNMKYTLLVEPFHSVLLFKEENVDSITVGRVKEKLIVVLEKGGWGEFSKDELFVIKGPNIADDSVVVNDNDDIICVTSLA